MKLQTFFFRMFLKPQRRRALFSSSSLIAILGIVIGVMALTISLGLFSGYESLIKETILGVNSHIYIMKYRNALLSDTEFLDIASALDTVSAVDAYAPYLYSEAMAVHGDEIAGVVLRGIDHPKENTATHFNEYIAKGQFSDAGAVLGSVLAKKINVVPGDTIYIVSPLHNKQTIGGIIAQRIPYTVSGIFTSGMHDYDSSLLFLSISNMQEFLGIEQGVTGIAVKLHKDSIDEAAIIAHDLQKKIGFPYSVSDWMALNGNLFELLTLQKWVIFIILGLITVVAGFGMISVLTMQIIDKQNEIGVMKALGAKVSTIKHIFLCRNLLIGGAGIFLGIVAGICFSWIISVTNLIHLPSDIYMIDHLIVNTNPLDLGIIILLSGIVILGSSLIPLSVIDRTDIVTILQSKRQ